MLVGVTAALALTDTIADPVIGLFLAVIAAAQLQRLHRYGPRARLAARPADD